MKRLVVGLLAHVDSGKTTLAEGLLYRAGVLRKLGRVDHRDAFLDTDAQERARGITIFAKQAVLALPAADGAEGTELTLLDTPGHVDFSAEAERALQVLDYAVLVISGTDGVQAHTETLWKLLARYRSPPWSLSIRWICPALMPRYGCGSCGGVLGTGAWISLPRRTPKPWRFAASR